MKTLKKSELERRVWKEYLASLLTDLVKYPISPEKICSDEYGFSKGIAEKSLFGKCPLILINQINGEAQVILPFNDFEELTEGKARPVNYISTAHWSYGRFNDNNKVGRNVFWKPLEAEGIRNTKLISEYLHMQKEVDIDPDDFRQELLKETTACLKNEVGVDVKEFKIHNSEKVLLVMDVNKPDVVTCYLPSILVNDLMYRPGERNWKEFVKSFDFELGVNIHCKRMALPNDVSDMAEACNKIWRALGVRGLYYVK